jgi:hypothetical protein
MSTPPRTYTVTGGGCYGSFYVRQLLAWADRRGGPVGRIVVVDRDPDCRVAREHTDRRLEIVQADWIDHLVRTLGTLRAHREAATTEAGATIDGRLVPSCWAPHLLLGALARLSGLSPIDAAEAREVLAGIGTPFARDLGNGSVAVSFATWICPPNCIEPAVCPETRGPLDWQVAGALRSHARAHGDRIRSCHVLECLHEAFGVGTIAMAAIVDELAALERVAAQGRDGVAMVATVSTCHGVAGGLRLPGR